MGLDATVRCNCFEEGKLKPGPVPYEDLYIDAEGYLASRKLDEASRKYDHRRFQARYGALEEAFEKWSRNCCEHSYGEYCDEWVSNWTGVREFCDLVEEVGGEKEFPLLSKLLPRANGGTYPAEKAQATLEELDRFINKVTTVDEWVLCAADSDEEIWSSTKGGSSTWMIGPFDRAGMIGGKVFFAHAGLPPVETTYFRQVPIGDPDNNGNQRMKIMCLDTGEESQIFDSLGPEDEPKIEREFYVTGKRAPFLFEGKYGTAERIKILLKASLKTGNPIRWC